MTGLNDRVDARISRSGNGFPPTWTMETRGTPRSTQGREPALVNSISPWAPVLSPWRPALIRSIVLAHGTAAETATDAARPGSPEEPSFADAVQPASSMAAQHASEASRGMLSGLRVMDSRVLEVMCL
jgi:hypothetical protein